MENIFISDFDGTITRRDFYWMVIDRYIGSEGIALYHRWQAKEMTDIDFLNRVFNSIGQPEKKILQDISMIPLDESFFSFINWLRGEGDQVHIVSAGCGYYIQAVLQQHGLAEIPVLSNPGYYRDGGIYMETDTASPWYHPVYGVDKGKYVRSFKQPGRTVWFAGDSRPDLDAARSADIAFAIRGSQLAEMMDAGGWDYVPFSDFDEIRQWMENHT